MTIPDRLKYHYEAISAHLEVIEHLSRLEGRNELVGQRKCQSGAVRLFKNGKQLEYREFQNRGHLLEILQSWGTHYPFWLNEGYYYLIS